MCTVPPFYAAYFLPQESLERPICPITPPVHTPFHLSPKPYHI